MRSVLPLASAVAAVLALAGCEPGGGEHVDLTRTTGAVVPAPSACVNAAPVARIAPSEPSYAPAVEAPQSGSESVEGLVSRLPLHEPHGSTYGDVGMPYPLPDVSAYSPLTLRAPPSSSASSATTDFPETSFSRPAAATATSDFPESSFGPSTAH